MRPIVVAILEDEKSQLGLITRHLSQILRHAGLEPRYFSVGDRKELQRVLAREHPHIAICDNLMKGGVDEKTGHQRPDDARYGLVTIAALKELFPHVVFCLLTRQAIKVEAFAVQVPNPDLLIPKSALFNIQDKYRDYLVLQFRRLIRRVSLHSIVVTDGDGIPLVDGVRSALSNIEGSKPSEAEFRALIEQVVFSTGFMGFDQEPKVVLQLMDEGFSGALLFSMRLLMDEKIVGVPSVLKVSRSRMAAREQDNYEAFVKWFLPHDWRVDVLGGGNTRDFGATCYSFAAAGSGRKAIGGTRLLRDRNREFIQRVLETIFDPRSKYWYGVRRTTGESISGHYSRRLFAALDGITEAETFFESTLKSLAKSEGFDFERSGTCIQIFHHKSEPIGNLLFTNSWGDVCECICHGDLHGGNIMYEPSSKILSFIDFQSTGFQHCVFDFIAFEGSLRAYFGIDWRPNSRISSTDVSFEELVDQELRLLSTGYPSPPPGEGELTHWVAIQQIRSAARQNFPDEPFSSYIFGLAAYLLWLLNFSSTGFARGDRRWPSEAVRRVAAALAACSIWLSGKVSELSRTE